MAWFEAMQGAKQNRTRHAQPSVPALYQVCEISHVAFIDAS